MKPESYMVWRCVDCKDWEKSVGTLRKLKWGELTAAAGVHNRRTGHATYAISETRVDWVRTEVLRTESTPVRNAKENLTSEAVPHAPHPLPVELK